MVGSKSQKIGAKKQGPKLARGLLAVLALPLSPFILIAAAYCVGALIVFAAMAAMNSDSGAIELVLVVVIPVFASTEQLA